MPKRPIIELIQEGRRGDIVLCLPIAKWYYDRGYDIYWPVLDEFKDMFDVVDYVYPRRTPRQPIKQLRLSGKGGTFWALETSYYDRIFRVHPEGPFDRVKYIRANVPFSERFNLAINRRRDREEALKRKIGWVPGSRLIHEEGSRRTFQFKHLKGVRMRPVEGFTVWDWVGIMEEAGEFWCVDSCPYHIANQLNLCVGRRYLWQWVSLPIRYSDCTLSRGWKRVAHKMRSRDPFDPSPGSSTRSWSPTESE